MGRSGLVLPIHFTLHSTFTSLVLLVLCFCWGYLNPSFILFSFVLLLGGSLHRLLRILILLLYSFLFSLPLASFLWEEEVAWRGEKERGRARVGEDMQQVCSPKAFGRGEAHLTLLLLTTINRRNPNQFLT